MLDAFIIEEIKRREKLREDRDRPQIDVPLPNPDGSPNRRSETEDDRQPHGDVIVIDLAV
jgi:hypothetical protein